MQIGVCTSVKNAAGLAAAGVEFIEENVQGFLAPRKDDAAFEENRKAAASSPVPVKAANCFLPGDLPCVGPAPATDAILEYAATAFRRAEAVGIGAIVFGSGGSRRVPENFERAKAAEQFTELLARLAPLAEKRGVTLVVEPLNKSECNFINSPEEAVELLPKCAHSSIKILVDLYHMAKDGQGPESITRCRNFIRHVHIAEVAGRTPPGAMGDDFRGYFKALRASGYDMGVSMECSWKDLVSEAAAGVACIREQWKSAG